MTTPTVDDVASPPERAAARRTFAIISHPDAGKTTLTEKLLLYGGAIEEAGAVKARSGRQRQVTSDWMEMERRRGISISSTVMQFTYRDTVLNLLDTPGHRDFSEDTYRVDDTGTTRSLNGPFSGFVFKIQANLDPHHRDRIAFLRVNTGRFTRGMRIVNVRTGREIGTKYAQQVFGRDRDTIEIALPGDVVGLVNAGDLRVGDTVTEGPQFRYPPIPAFAPEFFMMARNVDSSRSKQFRRGMTQLDEEGVIQVLTHPDRGGQEILLAAVGPMQYEVAAFRMEHEFGASIELSTTPYKVTRRTDQPGAAQLVRLRNVEVYQRSDGTHLALFPSRHHVDAVVRDHPRIILDTIVTT